MERLVIDQASADEMEFLVSSAKAEGWNPGLFDAVPFFHTDPNGFFIGKINGKAVGSISAVAYDDTYGFMGFYIVAPDYRGKGYGLELWNQAIAYLGNRIIGLDGVVDQQDNYKKSGFTLFYNNIRFCGKAEGEHSKTLQSLSEIPFQYLVDYDTSIFGLNRVRFLQSWIRMPNARGLAKTSGREVIGYGVIRQCDTGYKIGPLFSNDLSTAKEIFRALIASVGNADIYLDVPQINSDAMKLAQDHNLVKVFETARMYNKSPPKQELAKVFGVTTFELG
ncbi:MAG: GNAT family N-acetyltransferase [Chlamydiales bacterium]|nr:GNAT family N-acetyltransferase [Chlamydiales bacterium]